MGPAEPLVFEGHPHLLFEALAAGQTLPLAVLQNAWATHVAEGGDFAARVMAAHPVPRSAIVRAVADYLGFDFAEKLPEGIPAPIIALVSAAVARAYGIVPVTVDPSGLTVLTADPFHPHGQSDLAFVVGCPVRFAVADPVAVQGFLDRYYRVDSDAAGGVAAARVEGPPAAEPTAPDAELSDADIEKLAGQTPIVRLVNLVLAQAIRDRASDVHFEPFAREFKIRYRIDGELRELSPPARHLALPVISRLKVLANLDIAERRLPQDGRLTLNFGGRPVDLRISTLPTQHGESVVLRILDQASGQLQLSDLGLPSPVRSAIEAIIHRPNGILLVTGPTGSGKTTTLYSCLKQLNVADAKLLSVEDPVEYEVEGVMQVAVNPAAGLTFARALRTFLRQDPDIVMVGEVRDTETARVAIQAALTGHFVLATLHTNDAPGAVTRLVDMGIEPFLLASTLEGVLAQRLLRRVCPACAKSYEPDAEVLRALREGEGGGQGEAFYRGAGCSECRGTGYKGRVGIYEFLRVTDELRELITRGVPHGELRQQARRAGLITLRAAGVQAALEGKTTLDEVLKFT